MIPTITPEWLTDRLRSSGALPTGSVTGVLPESLDSDVLLPFQVIYSPDAPSSAPERLLLKANLKGDGLGLIECRVYEEVLGDLDDPPAPATYDVRFDPETGHGCLLQDDLSRTHGFAVSDEAPPTIERLGAVVDQVARVHAHTWDRSFLADDCFTRPRHDICDMAQASSRDELAENAERRIAQRLPRLFNAAEDLPREWQPLCARAIRAWSDLYARRMSEGNLTLIHADLHPWNVFVPLNGDGPPRIFDWELACRGMGIYDVAYLILRCRFPIEERRRCEESLIPRYHDRLLDLGVSGYPLDACRADYRLSLFPNLLPPLLWQRPHNLEATMQAFFDWSCEDLIDA